MLIAGLYYMLIACPYYMMMQLMLMAGLCLHLPPVLIPRCATSHPSWSPTCPATRTGAGPTVAEHQDQPAGPGQTWENSALRKSSQAETLHRGKKPSAREGGEQGGDWEWRWPCQGGYNYFTARALLHQISHRRGQMVAVNIKILIGAASLWTRVYLHQVRRLEL